MITIMKRLMHRLFFISAVLALVVVGCKKDVTPTVLKVITFPSSSALTSSVSSVTLLPQDSTSTNKVISFSWPAVDYGISAPVTYNLYFDVPTDTIGASPWGKAIKDVVGAGILTKSYTTRTLDSIALQLGLLPDSTSNMVVRVESFVDRSAYSNSVTFSVKPYKPVVIVPATITYLYIAGDFQGWNIGAAVPVACVSSNKKYEGYINIADGGTYQYKLYTVLGDWNSASFGDFGANQADKTSGATGKFKLANYAGSNFAAPSGGYYEVTFNFNDSTWTQTATTWSIIGDATPGGWSTDTQMTYDATNQVWKVTADMKTAGSFKFRANNDWKIDFGIDSKGNLAYADNPFFGYTAGLNNITVPADGNYTITLDLSHAGVYTYTAVKN